MVGLVGHELVAAAGAGEGVLVEEHPHGGWVFAFEELLAPQGFRDAFVDLVGRDVRQGTE